jgi:hypothetical protein
MGVHLLIGGAEELLPLAELPVGQLLATDPDKLASFWHVPIS